MYKSILFSFIDRLLHYDYFGAFYKNTLIYLTTNPDRDVVKHMVDDLFSVPRHQPNTRIPNQHTGTSTIQGILETFFYILFLFFIGETSPP